MRVAFYGRVSTDDAQDPSLSIYGKCKDRPDEGGCPYPLQIHNYSTCTRWAGLPESRLFDLRGAKVRRPMRGGAALEIFTGRTTVTIDAEDQDVLDSALQGLRNVRRDRPSPSLPPPVPVRRLHMEPAIFGPLPSPR